MQQQVRCLNISAYGTKALEALALLEQFPNLKELTWDHTDEGGFENENEDEGEDEDEDEEEFNRYTFLGKNALSTALLKNGAFGSLIELDINFLGDPSAYSFPKCKSSIWQLPNAPNLKKLKLHHYVNMYDLDDEDQSLLVSVNGLKELEISYYQRHCTNLLEQIIERYPNLKTLKVNYKKSDDLESPDEYEEAYAQSQLMKIAARIPHLETYDFDDPLSAIKDLVESNQKDSVETLKIDFSAMWDIKELNIMEIFKELQRFPKLKNLEMKDVYDNHEQVFISFSVHQFLKKFQH
ncbi:hypothetical protein [Parasitella parasitica]|uniref:F-box domain-containing protein n=1 Tax=Parasitella parasitica TaxID=35722 RepID=A0A0B7N1H9_9FUNG|nr:hypothetical protein [Parasitella parasitica]